MNNIQKQALINYTNNLLEGKISKEEFIELIEEAITDLEYKVFDAEANFKLFKSKLLEYINEQY